VTGLAQGSWLALLAVIATLLPVLSAQGVERPNILWIVTEDNSPKYVGTYGDPLARTPQIDQLAREGITFMNAHSAAPVCSVSRASIITGMYASSLGLQNHRSSHPLPADVRYFPEYLREAGYFTTNNAKTDYNTPQDYGHVWNENSGTAHWRDRAPGQPFFAVFNIGESHESSVYVRRPLISDPAKVHVPAYLPDAPSVRADIAQYYDAVAAADEKVGSLLKQLEADGLKDSTIVFYFSDHGGAVSGSKRFLLDHGTRIPIVARFPDRYGYLAPKTQSGRFAELVSAVDLAPTMLSIAGLPVPTHMQGRVFAGSARTAPPVYIFATRDRLDERYELSRAVIGSRFRYLRHFRPDLPNGRRAWSQLSASMHDWRALWQEGKLDSQQRSLFEALPPEQLFDVQADPDNVHDLAGDEKYRDELIAARKALRQHMLAVRDGGLMPESMMDELCAGRSPAVISRDVTVYPLEELLDLIDTVQLTPGVARRPLLAATRHPLPLFRYWSAIGSIGSKQPLGLNALLRDPDATVRLAAAEAAVKNKNGSKDQAWKEIIAALRPERSHALHLAAANIVADVSDRPTEAVVALRGLLPAAVVPFAVNNQGIYDLAGLLQTAENRSNPFMDEALKVFRPSGAQPQQSARKALDK